ncbi:stalk domain-containing protein [Paenibacillus sp. LjRoot153]|uniref:stalk domain-containing protein n=1 Tax=Paenibacillus sp. LjRoot153 TaxID=3342270 RepID=UPI003ECC7F49
MKKFIMGVVVGGILSLTSVVAASESIQAYLFPAFFTINGQNAPLDKEYAVLNYQGHAYVPVRFLAEQLGAFVDYSDEGMYKNIAINHFPSNAAIITDEKYSNIHFGLLDLYLDGGYTGIRGLLALDHEMDSKIKTEHAIEFKLHFYDANDNLIGTASGTSKSGGSNQKQTISTGEIKYVMAGEVGDFSKYERVGFEVTAYK